MNYEIERKNWEICRICNKGLEEIKKEFGGANKYFSQSFKNHIENHYSSLEEYFEKLGIERPKCSCGICNSKVNITIRGAKIYWRKYKCGRYPESLEWSKKAKIERLGAGNPMFGKKPWNLGLDKGSSPKIEEMSKKLKGRKTPENVRLNQSKAAFKRKIHGHTGYKHSEASKELIREKTLQRIKNGDFKHTKTKPHVEMSKILNSLNISYEEEYILGYWTFDFKINDLNLFIEVDGDYFHSNPKIYPNGPKTKTQKINYARDISKNNFCIKNNINLLRFWECDILNNPEYIKLEIICILKKLNQ